MTLKDLVQPVYDRTIRKRLPRKFGVYAGVASRDCRLLDTTDFKPEFKQGLIDAINEHVDEGDHVEQVGLGRGVSTVRALHAGADHVTAYEAAERMVQIATETLQINQCDLDRVAIRHALVGDAHNLYGPMTGAEVLDPADIGHEDCLVLDCEGSEQGILAGMAARPDVVIVESHPQYDAPTYVVQDIFEDLGYQVSIRAYEPDAPAQKHVLVGEAR